MRTRSEDPVTVWLASFPRSGNAFLRSILKSLFGMPSTTVYEAEARGRLSTFLTDGGNSGSPKATFTKTHELSAAQDDHAAIYLIRDGRDCYVSYAHFVMRAEPDRYFGMRFEDVLDLLVDSPDHFGGWSGHVDAWTRRGAPTALVRYEDLLSDPDGVASRACRSVGVALPAASGQLLSGEDLAAIDPLAFRRGETGSWRDEMPGEIEERFWQAHGETMVRIGYGR